MYLDYKVKIPDSMSGISRKTIKGVTYIYYSYGRKYDPSKKYTVPINTTIGKCTDSGSDMMYPNTNFLKHFPETKDTACRSGSLRIGAFLVLRRIIVEYHLDEIIDRLIGRDSGLFLDLIAYSIIAENNAGQYYSDYAYSHPLFTKGMKIYSDSKVSDFINSITRDQSIALQNEWNQSRDHREKIYIPAAIRELEKIEILRQPDRSYRLDHAVTATQKEILKVFHMTAKNITEQAIKINENLHKMNQ